MSEEMEESLVDPQRYAVSLSISVEETPHNLIYAFATDADNDQDLANKVHDQFDALGIVEIDRMLDGDMPDGFSSPRRNVDTPLTESNLDINQFTEKSRSYKAMNLDTQMAAEADGLDSWLN